MQNSNVACSALFLGNSYWEKETKYLTKWKKEQRFLWRLILCVSLAGLRGTQTNGKHFWVCLGGCFQKTLAFESVDGVKTSSFTNAVGTIQSSEELNRTRGGGKEFALGLSWDIHLLLPSVILTPGPQAFWLRLNDTPSFRGSPTCRWQTVGLLGLQTCRYRDIDILYSFFSSTNIILESERFQSLLYRL